MGNHLAVGLSLGAVGANDILRDLHLRHQQIRLRGHERWNSSEDGEIIVLPWLANTAACLRLLHCCSCRLPTDQLFLQLDESTRKKIN